MYNVYILLLKNKKLYTGFTENVMRRKEEHDAAKVKSTKNLLPVKLLHYESYLLKTDAMRRERFLKTTEGKRLLKMQIRDILIMEGVI